MAFTRQGLGPNFNEGARLLWEAIAAASDSVREIDRAAGATTGMSIRWLYGDQKPGTGYRVKLFERYSVPILAWDQAPTLPFVVPALREADVGPVVAAAKAG